MDDRTLFRYGPDYAADPAIAPALDWSAWPGPQGGLLGAVEMCNNNGTCRKSDANVMCPSFRATQDEQHLTRGRANTLRLALTGQLPRRRWPRTRSPTPWSSASPARGAGGNARPASTWPS